MIVQFSDLQKIKLHKENVVKGMLISYYRDLAEVNGIDIPYFLKAEASYKEHIKSMKDLNHFYNLIMKGSKC